MTTDWALIVGTTGITFHIFNPLLLQSRDYDKNEAQEG